MGTAMPRTPGSRCLRHWTSWLSTGNRLKRGGLTPQEYEYGCWRMIGQCVPRLEIAAVSSQIFIEWDSREPSYLSWLTPLLMLFSVNTLKFWDTMVRELPSDPELTECISVHILLPGHPYPGFQDPSHAGHSMSITPGLYFRILIFTCIQTLKVKICIWIEGQLSLVWLGHLISDTCFLCLADFIFLHSWVQLHWLHTPRFHYPFFFWWAFQSVPFPCYCEECSSKHANLTGLISELFLHL